jgi:hypothetical protein
MNEPSTMWICNEQSLRESLEECGVQDVKRWACPCNMPTCQTYVLFGIGHSKNKGIRSYGTMPNPSARILWVVCSFVFIDDHHNFVCGMDIDESVGDLLEHWAKGDVPRQQQASLLSLLCAMGLAQELEAELQAMRAS